MHVSRVLPAGQDTVMRLLDLYRHTDPTLARALEERVDLAAIAGAGGMQMVGGRPVSNLAPPSALTSASSRRRGQVHVPRGRPARGRALLRWMGHACR